jgi:DNA-binding Xre family transcriptional regulator
MQKTSLKKQKCFYNDANGFKMDTKGLAAFVSKVMDDNNLKERQVATASGGGITHSQVHKIKMGDVEDSGVGTLQALARGLQVPEEIIFAIARGVPLTGEHFAHARIAAIDALYTRIEKQDDRLVAKVLIEMVERELRLLAGKAPAIAVSLESGGDVISLEDARRDNDLKNGRLEKMKKPK